MAHLIDFTNARANMAYVGETPWHGLGQKLTEDAPIEVWAKEAGMEHEIKRSHVEFTLPNGDHGFMDDKQVLYRSDNNMALAVVSAKYQVVQPMEVLEFYRDLVNSTGEYQLETAGCLDDGRKYWALARHKDTMNFGGDIVKPYLMLASSADGTMATIAQHTSVRVVCNNTLQMSLHDKQHAVKVSHKTKFDAETVKQQLGVIETIDQYKTDVELLINKAISKAQAAEIFVEMIAKRDKHGNINNEKAVKRVVGEIMDSLMNGPGANLQSSVNTAWGAMNAVTHYVDFKARAHSQNNRFSSGQFGLGADLKQKAFEYLVAA